MFGRRGSTVVATFVAVIATTLSTGATPNLPGALVVSARATGRLPIPPSPPIDELRRDAELEGLRSAALEVNPRPVLPDERKDDPTDCAVDRFTSCSRTAYDAWSSFTDPRGVTVVDGHMSIYIDTAVEFDYAGSAGWTLVADVFSGEETGVFLGGAWGTLSTGCPTSTVCVADPQVDDAAEGSSIRFAPGVSRRVRFHQRAAAIPPSGAIDLTPALGLRITVNGPHGVSASLADFEPPQLAGRCDDLPNKFGAGCVDPRGAAFVVFDATANPKVQSVAAHVYDAIRTLPSRWGSPFGKALIRTTDPARRNANRAVACRDLVVPAGQECDEFPFATTVQGGDGAAPGDRSARAVPGPANKSQGGTIQNSYDYYRVLDNGEFLVNALLAPGQSAW